MIKLVLTEIIEALHGGVIEPPPAITIPGVSTDSRTTREGEIFFAIPGERFDGHDFVAGAFERGAVAAVVANARVAALRAQLGANLHTRGGLPLLVGVPEVVEALGKLANFHRRQSVATVIAVVGSNGKTTCKQMIDHVLAGKLAGRASPKSFNNSIGVPLTLLSAERGDEYLVVEVGTNSPGEIAALARIAQPDMAVLTSIGEEHLEKLGDLRGVAREEAAIFGHLRGKGFAAINIDSPEIRDCLPAGPTLVKFGRAEDADLRITRSYYEQPWLHFTINNRFEYRLPLPGVHNTLNAAGAIAVARRLGLEHDEIAARLKGFAPPPMRNEILQLGDVTVINDAYNANPGSTLAALEMLENFPTSGRRFVVFGEMRELGPRSAELHGGIADRLRLGRFDRVILTGAAAKMMSDRLPPGGLFGPRVDHCDTVEECGQRLRDELKPGDTVLLKASRAVGLERVLEPLRERGAQCSVVPPGLKRSAEDRGLRSSASQSAAPETPPE